jgi:hypothetical protein
MVGGGGGGVLSPLPPHPFRRTRLRVHKITIELAFSSVRKVASGPATNSNDSDSELCKVQVVQSQAQVTKPLPMASA